ncbi:MAG TPA: DUF1684 domain-containing protein [Streptosporangiaceae bacterium]
MALKGVPDVLAGDLAVTGYAVRVGGEQDTHAVTGTGGALGSASQRLIIDLNFSYHPPCRYDDRWVCPLGADHNTIDVPIRARERLALR